MFQKMRRQWREARGPILRREFEDTVLRLNALGSEANLRASETLAREFRRLQDRYGSLANVSNDGKRRLATDLRSQAKQYFTCDMGRGYGLALLSMYVESQAVPGPDSRLVQSGTEEFLRIALAEHVVDSYANLGSSPEARPRPTEPLSSTSAPRPEDTRVAGDHLCEGCGSPSHREWELAGLPNCGRKRCLVRMVVSRAGYRVGEMDPTLVASAGLNQLLKRGFLRKSGWKTIVPTPEIPALLGELIAGLPGKVQGIRS